MINYLDVLKDILKDLVNLCGEDINKNYAKKEIDEINEKIKKLEEKDTLSSDELLDTDLLKNRRQNLLTSSSLIANKILEDFNKEENNETILQDFKELYLQAEQAFQKLTNDIEDKSIWNTINEKNIEYIQNKNLEVPKDLNQKYSNIVSHYINKESLTKRVIASINEKINLVDENINLMQDIIDNIANEIKDNKEKLLEYNEKKYQLSSINSLEEDYEIIDEEMTNLREIRAFNEKELKEFNTVQEKYLKEKESLEKELKNKNEELEEVQNKLNSLKLEEDNGKYISKENIINHEITLNEQKRELEKLNLQKNLLCFNLSKSKEMFEDIINNKNKTENLTELKGKYSEEEIDTIEKYIAEFNVTKEEAIEAIESNKNKEKNEKLIKEYMEEFDFTYNEAEEAIDKEQNKFWNTEE